MTTLTYMHSVAYSHSLVETVNAKAELGGYTFQETQQ